MSRIGKLPILIPNGVSVAIEGNIIKLSGPKGTLERPIPVSLKVSVKDDLVYINTDVKSKAAKSLHGTFRAILANAAKGVSEGWLKQLELVGTGYRAELRGKDLALTVGFSHPIIVQAPEGIIFKIEKNVMTVEGIDKDLVGRIAAEIRQVKPPEPYKGKGILYLGETVRRKAGKAAKAQGQTV
jgi:large subunit ribosomal protein L6